MADASSPWRKWWYNCSVTDAAGLRIKDVPVHGWEMIVDDNGAINSTDLQIAGWATRLNTTYARSQPEPKKDDCLHHMSTRSKEIAFLGIRHLDLW